MEKKKWISKLFLIVSILTVFTTVFYLNVSILANDTDTDSGDKIISTSGDDEIDSGDNTDDTDTKSGDDEDVDTKSGDSDDKTSDDDSAKSGDVGPSGDTTTSGDNKSSADSSTGASSSDTKDDTKVKKYKITTILEKGGKIVPENPEVEEGKDQKFEIIPYEKYKITDVIVDGINYGSTSIYTIKDIKEEHEIEVKFLKITNEAKEEEKAWDNPFADINSSDWFYDSVRYVNKHGLFKGLTETEFAPNNHLTRGMLVTVLYRFSGSTEYAKSTFDDVAQDSYYSEAVSWATKIGIVNGVGDNKFSPDSNITRQDLATIIYRYAKFKGKGFAIKSEFLLDYSDRDKIADYAYEAICWCTTTEIITGKGENIIDPIGLATRAETATIMQRLAEFFEK